MTVAVGASHVKEGCVAPAALFACRAAKDASILQTVVAATFAMRTSCALHHRRIAFRSMAAVELALRVARASVFSALEDSAFTARAAESPGRPAVQVAHAVQAFLATVEPAQP
jgi:hypothetical protein